MRTQHPGSSAGSAPVGPAASISLPHVSEPQFVPSVKGSDPCDHKVGQGVPTQGGVGMGVCVQVDKSPRTSVAPLSLHTGLLKLDFRCFKVENPHPNVQAMRRHPPSPTPCSSPRLANCLEHQFMPTRPQLETARNTPFSPVLCPRQPCPPPGRMDVPSPPFYRWKN